MNVVVETPGLDLAGYLAAVRRELADLGADEVDELTGGLEADLADALGSTQESPEQMFGSPRAYAAELRAAAGLPPEPVTGTRSSEIRRRGTDLRTWMLAQVWWPGVRDFAVTCRPLWWAFRAYVVYQFVAQRISVDYRWAPDQESSWALLLVLVVASIELGRRKWPDGNRLRSALILGVNLLAIWAVAVAVYTLMFQSGWRTGLLPVNASTQSAGETRYVDNTPHDGVFNAGYQLVNIFPYDSDGNPLEGVQLYDDKGRRLEPVEKGYTDKDYNFIEMVPALSADGQPRYNVYPLNERVEKGLVNPDGIPVPAGIRAPTAPDRMQFPVVPVPTAEPEKTAEPEPTMTEDE